MKTIYILLTRSTTIVSRMVHFCTADPYTHVSFAFNEQLAPLYSSSRLHPPLMLPAGPCEESLSSGYYKHHNQIPCKLYTLSVPDDVYYEAKAETERIVASGEYHYNILGLLLCQLNIAYPRSRHYFCSQFAGEVLARSNALALPKHSSLMRPMDYGNIPSLKVRFQGILKDLPI